MENGVWVLRVYRALCESDALRGLHIFLLYGFTDLICLPTSGPSGGSIFRCTTKDRGERRAKGVATPFNPPELMQDRKPDVLWLYLLATVRLTRLSRLRCREANTLGVRCRLFPCLSVLHQLRLKSWHSKNNQRFVNSAVGWLRECSKFPPSLRTSAHTGVALRSP